MPSDKFASWDVIELMSPMHSAQGSHVQAIECPWLLGIIDSCFILSLYIREDRDLAMLAKVNLGFLSSCQGE